MKAIYHIFSIFSFTLALVLFSCSSRNDVGNSANSPTEEGKKLASGSGTGGGGTGGSGTGGGGPAGSGSGENGGGAGGIIIDILDGAKSASVLHFGQIYHSYLLMAGLRAPSSVTNATFNEKRTSFSIEGAPDAVTAPLYMAVTDIASEVCRDLVNQERLAANQDKRFFNSVNFGVGPSQFTNPGIVEDLVRRQARSFWARNETAGELLIINEEIAAASAGAAETGIETQKVLQIVCTGMIASLSAIEI